ncbi:MAG: hypothetical protein JSU83_12275 [Deltaproteobacteria bacterium]|nr:MAG: hypothetical protein JSU83_12275 [Deltaproteobacteria bacterium]
MEYFDPSTSKASIKNLSETNLRLVVGQDLMPSFYRLLAKGFMVNVRGSFSIKELLCQQLGIPDDYLEERIQTIFLDGKAVDNVSSTIVKEGSTLALSAAMPGVVGAMLRKGGYYAAMRAQISHPKEDRTNNDQTGKVKLKLFNLTAKEIGPFFLDQGIWISGTDLENILSNYRSSFQTGCRLAELNKKKLTIDELCQLNWQGKEIFLQVKVSKDG